MFILGISDYDEELLPDHVRNRMFSLGRTRPSWVDDEQEEHLSREFGGGGGC